MDLLRCQYMLQGISGLPEDRYVNTLYFSKNAALDRDPVAGDGFKVATIVQALFSTTIVPPTKRVSEYWSQPALAATGQRIKVYAMSDPEDRVPIYDQTFTLPGMVATTGLPAEVCVCLSFAATAVSGTAQARRRGRIFIGPLNTAASDATTNVRPSVGIQQALTGAAKLLGTNATTNGLSWVVYSPTNGLGLSSYPVVSTVWVDNAFDTQRRRGNAPNSRLTVATP